MSPSAPSPTFILLNITGDKRSIKAVSCHIWVVGDEASRSGKHKPPPLGLSFLPKIRLAHAAVIKGKTGLSRELGQKGFKMQSLTTGP